MEFFKVDHKMSRPFGCEIVIWMDAKVRVVTFVGKERRDSCGCVRSVVVGELSDREKLRPIVLLIGAVDANVLFQGLIHSFGLSVCFRMIARSEVKFHFQCFA